MVDRSQDVSVQVLCVLKKYGLNRCHCVLQLRRLKRTRTFRADNPFHLERSIDLLWLTCNMKAGVEQPFRNYSYTSLVSRREFFRSLLLLRRFRPETRVVPETESLQAFSPLGLTTASQYCGGCAHTLCRDSQGQR